MLNNGLMIPSPASPANKENTAKPTTITPADLKKSGACFPCAKEADPKERKTSIGNVPRAKANIIKKPDKNDPLPMAATCIDWVNPQGKKKVAKPTTRGVKVLCSILLKTEKTF